MRIKFFSAGAVAFNEYGECAKIEGYMFRVLLQDFQKRKTTSKKSETRIIREIVEAWPRDALNWVDAKEANK
jgi:hypothetical protein